MSGLSSPTDLRRQVRRFREGKIDGDTLATAVEMFLDGMEAKRTIREQRQIERAKAVLRRHEGTEKL